MLLYLPSKYSLLVWLSYLKKWRSQTFYYGILCWSHPKNESYVNIILLCIVWLICFVFVFFYSTWHILCIVDNLCFCCENETGSSIKSIFRCENGIESSIKSTLWYVKFFCFYIILFLQMQTAFIYFLIYICI